MNNNSDQLLAYPIIEELEYRSTIDSKQLNEMLRSLEESVLRSLLRGTKLSEDLNRLNLAVTSSYIALESQLANKYPPPDRRGLAVAFCSAFGDVDLTQGGRQNSTAGIVTMPWNDNKKISKISIYDGVVSPNIQIYVDGTLRPQSDPVYNILDKDNSTFWIEQTTPGVHTLELVLPNSINKTFNYLEVVPFPLFGINISGIEYSDTQSRLKSIFPNTEYPFYNQSGPLVFHLTPREFNNTIKITFTVNDNINAMGFSSIDICNIDYLNNSSTIYFKFENLPTDIVTIYPVQIELDFYADGILDNNYDQFITKVALVKNQTNPYELPLTKVKDQFIPTTTFELDNSEELYLKVVMNEVGMTTPVFRGAKLIFNY